MKIRRWYTQQEMIAHLIDPPSGYGLEGDLESLVHVGLVEPGPWWIGLFSWRRFYRMAKGVTFEQAKCAWAVMLSHRDLRNVPP
jgi:hypothetical protein